MILKIKPFFLSPWCLPVTLLFWAIVVYISFINRSVMMSQIELEMARMKGETVFHLIQTTRQWNTLHGAVYVPETENTPANPYLFVPEKNITTPSGRALTQINPAYMTRQLAELLQGGAVEISLTSKQLLNPNNYPDDWELAALNLFEQQGVRHVEEQVDQHFRYMAPLYIEPGCQACHFGYQVGDIRGGISVSFPIYEITHLTDGLRHKMLLLHLFAFVLLSMIGLILAISIRKLLESKDDSDELRRLNSELALQHQTQQTLLADLNATRIEAEKSNKAKSEFLATMSHEVRTPMNAIIGLLELLSRDKLPEKQQGLVAVIRQSAAVLLRILDDILDFSRMESGRLALETIPIRLTDILQGVKAIFDPMCEERGVKFVIKVDSKVPEYVHGDPVRISQILHNLISNAVKFSSGTKDSSGNSSGEVTVTLDWLNEQLQINVIDNGIGISDEQIERIFTPFSQAEGSTTRKYGGSGLGLTIVQRLTDMMDGQLTLESELGKGSRFKVTLPLLKLNASEIELISQQLVVINLTQSFDPSEFRVLVAEDDRVNQMVIEQQLGKLGYQFKVVNDGVEALDAWLQAPDSFDLILTDLHMPNMDGISLVQAVRNAEAKSASVDAAIPIVILTANVLSGVLNKPEFKLSGQLTKPVRLDEFAETLMQALLKRDGKNRSINNNHQRHENEQTKAESKPALAVYDPQALKQVVGDNPETLKELQQMYISVSEQQMQLLSELWQTDQSDQRVMLLHKLKSSSRSTGAMHLGQRFEHYEHLSRKTTQPLPLQDWLDLKKDYESFIAELRKAING